VNEVRTPKKPTKDLASAAKQIPVPKATLSVRAHSVAFSIMEIRQAVLGLWRRLVA
jgi:chromatin licensing and DNA replication factor 1